MIFELFQTAAYCGGIVFGLVVLGLLAALIVDSVRAHHAWSAEDEKTLREWLDEGHGA